ncbi:MAG: hypothetical protein U0003_00595 [Vampirovibrionales bacterium]
MAGFVVLNGEFCQSSSLALLVALAMAVIRAASSLAADSSSKVYTLIGQVQRNGLFQNGQGLVLTGLHPKDGFEGQGRSLNQGIGVASGQLGPLGTKLVSNTLYEMGERKWVESTTTSSASPLKGFA